MSKQFQVHYDDDSQSCINVVLEAHYTLVWQGQPSNSSADGGGQIVGVAVDILMGNISLPRDFKRVEKFGKTRRPLPHQEDTRRLTQVFKVRKRLSRTVVGYRLGHCF